VLPGRKKVAEILPEPWGMMLPQEEISGNEEQTPRHPEKPTR
jgi:hypothetical protein